MNSKVADIYELSPLQQGMLIHAISLPHSSVFNMQMDFALEGTLDVQALEESWAYIVSRHDVLRTAIVWVGVDKPYQVVHRSSDARIVRHDWSDMEHAEQQALLRDFVREDRERAFDLGRPTLIRTSLIILGESRFRLVWTFHHIILEGWSAAILAGEFWQVYDRIRSQHDPGLPPVHRYVEYISWLKRQDQSQAEAYWREKLKGFSSPTELPIDRAPAGDVTPVNRLGVSREALTEQQSAALRELARRNRVTVNTIVQGMWSLLLSRYSGDRDVVYGAALSGRPADLQGSESIVGLFVNVLPVRVEVNPQAPVFPWLQQLQLDQARMRQFEYSSLMSVKSWSDVPGGQPLFHTMIAFENWLGDLPAGSVRSDLKITGMNTMTGSDQPVTLLAAMGARLTFELMYDVERFEQEAIQRLMSHFRTLLESLLVNPDSRIAELSLLSEEERRRILQDWNATTQDYGIEESLTRLIERQVDRTPDSVAVEFRDERLTYGELEVRSNRLAHRLVELGVGPDTLVGVFMERSLDMVVALLGVLKAGGAYVPLDPDYPRERIRYMLDDTNVPVVLCQQALAQRLPESAAQVICCDSERDSPERYPASRPDAGAAAGNLAYVIYTSGSTGQPKGVMNEHRGVVNRLLWMQSQFRLDASDRVLQKTPYSFDVSVWEFFWPLMTGAGLVLAEPGGHKDPAYLSDVIERKRISTLHFVPSMLHAYLEQADLKAAKLKRVICSGEALSRTLQDRFHEASNAGLYNLYGPTEAAIDVTSRECRRDDEHSRVPIGRPIANTRIYILDERMQPVPPGIAGELYIGGIQVARGYLNRPELTAERFVADPYSDEAGARLYRTGDLARYLADGDIEYLGRIDNQVKLRGFRIELGEIESVLAEHAGVSAAVVTIREDGDEADRRLVAYVVRADEAEASVAELRAHLEAKLPQYMVPSAIVWLEALPLTANGKIDYRSLPAPAAAQERDPGEIVEPRDAVEREIAAVWREALQLDRVSIRDNFFTLGGHSLLAVKIVGELNRRYGIDISFAQFMGQATIENLAVHIRGILQAPSETAASPPLQARVDATLEGQVFPLSYAQERLWYIHTLYPDVSAYNVQMHVRIDAAPATVTSALEALQQRHAILRTTYALEGSSPVQVLHATMAVARTDLDIEGLAEAELQQRVTGQLYADAQTPFDLEGGPVWRSTVVHAGGRVRYLYVTIHHIATDGRSMEVLKRELEQLCGEDGAERELVPVLQYADYALWHREHLERVDFEALQAYWSRQLEGIPSAIDLPTDRVRPPVYSYSGALEYVSLSDSLSGRLRRYAKEQQVTLFMVMLAAYEVLLARYTQQTDIVVGTPVSGRTRPEMDGIVGLFVNSLVLRTRVEEGATYRELLQSVRETTLAAFEHHEMPFEKLVELLQPDRDLSRNPVFQVMFSFLPSDDDPETERRAVSEQIESSETAGAHVDLTLFVKEHPAGIDIGIQYNTDLFDAATIKRMTGHYRNLLESAVRHPDEEVYRLKLLDEQEKEQLIHPRHVWEPEGMRATESLVRLFERQVDRTPDTPAIQYEETRISYIELNERANRLARYLIDRGAGPNVLVGICMERSLDLPVAILGVLKTGAGYLPMDPQYPAERVGFMLQDSASPLLLTQASMRETLSGGDARVVCMDSDRAGIERESADNPGLDIDIESTAYVIYTSGTTGRPKGVIISHRNVVRLFSSTRQWYDFNASDVWALFHSSAFDFSVWEIWGALLHGGKLVVVPYVVSRSPDRFHRLLADAGVTVLNQTPSAFRQLMAFDRQRTDRLLEGLRFVIFGGEALDPQSLLPWFEKYGERRPQLVNMYGITETTVHVTCRPLTSADATAGASRIGRPIPDLRVYILDRYRQPVAIGIPGEMYVGGEGLAKGYLNRPELTAERFVADPYSDEAGARLYRTGDLARYLADGDIEYLGRIDNQVKLRGFRIELGEIESVLAEHAGVSAAVVTIREDGDEADRRLVAYVVRADEAEASVAELRAHLEAKLPQYMVPSAIVWLEALPLTANGKIDYRSLPAPAAAQERDPGEIVEPRDAVEREIAAVWREALQLDRVSIRDNFFTLGGHSLLAVKIVGELNRRYGIDISFAQFMGQATIENLAVHIRGILQAPSETAASPPLQARVDATLEGQVFPLSYAQERLWYIHTLYPDVSAYNVQMHVRIDAAPATVTSALEALQQRHAILRTTYALEGSSPVQVLHATMAVARTDLDIEGLAEAELQQRVTGQLYADAQTPFDLEGGPVWRSTVVHAGGRVRYLYVTIHHIATDGRSMEVLKRELEQLCGEDGAERELVPVLQYADYALWHREHLERVDFEALQAYWSRQLEGIPSAIDLPTDRVRPPVYSYSGALEYVSLSDSLSGRLRRYAKEQQVTLFMVMLAAYEVLLARYTQQTDIVVGTPVSGRTRPEMDGIVGLFVNSLVLRTRVEEGATYRELLQSVRETTLAAFEHHEMPFEKLVELLQPDRDLSRNPVFQVMFNFEQDTSEENAKVELSQDIESSDLAGAQVDQTLYVKEMAGRLLIAVSYNTDIFERQSVQRMLEHYRNILEAAVDAPETDVRQLDMLSRDEYDRIVHQWNRTDAAFPRNETVCTLFRSHVRRTPQAIAVRFDDQELTYSQLDAMSACVAGHLQRRDVRNGQLIGVYMDRSPEMIVALMGILRAGAAYVPLDPDYPRERIDYMIADSAIRFVLTQRRHESRLDDCPAEAVYVDDPDLSAETMLEDAPDVQPGDLVYVIYTSGSTGNPKGVMISHRSVINHMSWMQQLFHFEPADRVLQKTPISFDASVWEIFLPLLTGAAIVLAKPGGHKDGEYMIREIARNRITTLQLVPSALRMLLHSLAGPEDLESLKRVCCGGEVLTAELAAEYHEKCKAPLYNLYGPTEATIDSTTYQCSATSERSSVPIGRPVANTKIYILDDRMQPVPVGVRGEIHIAGEQVAAGYWGRADLTSEKFIDDPFLPGSGRKMYRTGDLARYRADGTIEYIGRVDKQVKLRGYRIELGEVEHALLSNDDVRAATVVVREDEPGDQRLVAYIISSSTDGQVSEEVQNEKIREYLKQRLPDFMMPSALVWMDVLPLMPNGKIDYHALPKPSGGDRRVEGTGNTPETELEIVMARIWEELLDVDDIETNDMFFDLGGHSLLTLKVVEQFEAETGIRLSPVHIVNRTLKQLVAGLEPEAGSSPKGRRSSQGVLGAIRDTLLKQG